MHIILKQIAKPYCGDYFSRIIHAKLNDHEIENHYKMNSENGETWHGIIISPT